MAEPTTPLGSAILRLFEDGRELTRQDICDLLGRDVRDVQSVLVRLKRTPKQKIYVKDYVAVARQPLALYALGDAPDMDRDEWNDRQELARRTEPEISECPAAIYIDRMVRLA